MMKRITTIIAVAIVAFVASNASANDHFARQRQEAAARQAAAKHHLNHGHRSGAHYDIPNYRSGHWGGVTTNQRYYHPTHGHQHQRQNVQFYPVNPFGYGYGYRVPSYGFYGGGTGIYIHRDIYLSR